MSSLTDDEKRGSVFVCVCVTEWVCVERVRKRERKQDGVIMMSVGHGQQTVTDVERDGVRLPFSSP